VLTKHIFSALAHFPNPSHTYLTFLAINLPNRCMTYGQLVVINGGAEFLLYGGRCNKTDLVIVLSLSKYTHEVMLGV
jgi:hypothetical protein